VESAGATPIVDCTSWRAPVPDGAWVRVVRAQDAPGTGPVLLAEGPPVPGRECWLERTTAGSAPPGFAGVVLRGLGSGGRAGDDTVEGLLTAMPPGVPTLIDWPHGPDEKLPDVDGVILSDVLLSALELGPALGKRLERLGANDLRRIRGQNMVASVASPAFRRVASGEAVERVAEGWLAADDAFEHAWPGGAGLMHATGLHRRHGGLEAIIRAYRGPAAAIVTRLSEGIRAEPDQAAGREPVAIIGMGCRLPGAASIPALWSGLQSGWSAIVEVPPSRWDPALFWDPDRSVPDKTYAKIGGFVTDFSFNPRRFRIPPAAARLIDPIQQMALEASADAMEDAGYDERRAFDRERVAVILGNSMGGEITDDYVLRTMFPSLRRSLEGVPGFASLPELARGRILDAYEQSVKEGLPPITEDSMPGELANVVAGRIANALNLGGPNFTTDAACAGSMAAIQAAVKGLQDRDFDMVITGGADRSMGVATYTKFCKIGALSPDGSRPFDAGANGFVMGEGVGILVLKRLRDALRDGDRVYAVVRGIGASSDGKGKGITAPNPDGQRRALSRAYEDAAVDPVDVDLFECHGTSTIVGDKVEVESLAKLVGEGRRAGRPARIGSIKSNIGHLKSAAGAAALLKATLSLHHAVLPASINYRTRRKDLDLDGTPMAVQARTEAWEGTGARFCGVSAFGFGGTNFHVVLQDAASARAVARPLPVAPASAHAPPSPPAALPLTRAPVPSPAVSVPVPAAPVSAPAATPVAIPGPRPTPIGIPVPQGLWALSGDSPAELSARLRALREGRPPAPYEPDAPLRVAAAAGEAAELDQQIERTLGALSKGKGYELVRQRGIALEDVPCDGQLAFLFTGQGSQYIGMGLDLAAHFPVVADTFREADEVMEPLLGRPLTGFIERNPALTEEEQFEALRATEISQPATLTVDTAILRLLAAWGLAPDVVAGHSLGEYGAAVAAGMLSFRDALTAVSARGREMAAVRLDDKGKMAGIAASVETVMEVLAEVPGYVVPANKNCPTQTVIAGESDAVEAACEVFRSRGITVYPLPVSHAFHSRIVAPASEPLRRVLEKLDIHEPRRRITTNVDSRYYPTGAGAREAAIDVLARQVAAPVEWTAQVERMYGDGARIFVECGPKRALAGFVVNILKHRPHRALYANQPKRGGVLSFLDCLASLFVLGFPVRSEPTRETTLFFEPGPRRSTTPAIAWRTQARTAVVEPTEGGTPAMEEEILKIVSAKTGYPIDELDPDFELEADLGIDTVKLADIVATVRERFRLEQDPAFRLSDHRTLRSIIDYAGRRLGATRSAEPRVRAAEPLPAEPAPAAAVSLVGAEVAARFLADVAQRDLRGLDAAAFATAMMPSLQAFLAASWDAFQAARPAPLPVVPAPAPVTPAPAPAPVVAPAPAGPSLRPAAVGTSSAGAPTIVCSGASVGLPGGEEVFAPDNVRRILRGENRITPVPEEQQDRFLAKNLVRLTKDPATGEGSFLPVSSRDQVIRLAGRRAAFDLVAQYGVDPGLARSLDITTQLALAAAIEALRDAGIPLVRTFRQTTTGKAVATGWALPEGLRDGTGIVFASAFPGYDTLLEKLDANGDDGEGRFDRRFLFQVLSMGHSQLAQFLGARGPNTQVNAACASTTQALAIAEDWIRVGRAERVIVVGADDVTSDRLLEWIGAGFMAAGAATTEARVEDAALPFDRRRHGMILGMGAAGLVLERAEDVAARGMAPVATLLGTRVGNSAFHGTRLDAAHISREVTRFVDDVVTRARTDRDTFASHCVFLSHETYTPARGGSAAAEMASLPAAFGPSARRILIANTKGFTGHPMGAGIEDTVSVKALQYGEVPPIANLKEPDPDLGELSLSPGGAHDVRFALRLAAGFGSQLALAAWRRAAHGDERVTSADTYQRWLTALGGRGHLVVEDRQLRWVAEDTPVAQASPETGPPRPTGDDGEMLRELVRLVGEKTGYAPEELDPAYELEADLGIDTVKQAEIFGTMRERHGLERDDSFKLADYPTLEKLAGYLSRQVASSPEVARRSDGEVPAARPEAPAPPPAGDDTLDVLLAAVAKRTGYGVEELDPAYELEADLGIDTVKQAEVFGEVRERLGIERDDSFKLADHPTLRALAAYLDSRRSGPPRGGSTEPLVPAGTPPTEPEPPSASEVTGEPQPPGTPEVVEMPAIPAGHDRWGSGADAHGEWTFEAEPVDVGPSAPWSEVPVAEEPVPVDAAPETEVPALPASFRIRRPIGVSRARLALSSLKGRGIWVLGAGPLAEALRADALRRGASLDGEADAVIDAGLPALEGFHQARRLDTRRPRDWIAVGAEQPASAQEAWSDGARAGLAKALGREWPGCRGRAVRTQAGAPEDVAASVLDELTEIDGAIEVTVGPGRREVTVLAADPFPPHVWLAHPVVMLTGGTRGITAQVALEMARKGPCTLILVARTLPGAEPLDEDRAKEQAKMELRAAGRKTTPRLVEEKLRPLRVAEEARSNVARMRDLGADVEVLACDMADPAAVRELIRSVLRRHRGLDVVVHGAGVEESRQLQDKDEAGFKRVFDGKAVGGLALMGALPPDAFFVSMGSIAGRFGNAGQVDYAAANEAMAAVCRTRPRSLHVCWTAWGDVGMAVRGGMETLLTTRGIELLPAPAGAALLCDMIGTGVTGEVLVAGALGDFRCPPLHPLLDDVELVGDVAIARRSLTLTSDPWMADHAIDGTPVLPGVIGLEMMVAAALSAHPRGRYVGAEDITFNAPLKLYRDEPTMVEVRAEPTGDGAVLCRLSSTRKSRAGREFRTDHFEALVQLEEMPLLAALPAIFGPEESLAQREIYRRFFHGPAFQVLRDAEWVAIQGLLATAAVEHASIAEGLLTDPLVLEAAFQAAGLHRMAVDGVMALPAGVDAVELVRPVLEGETLSVAVLKRGAAYDIDVDGSEGRVMRVRGFRMVEKGPLGPQDRFPEPEGGWVSAGFAEGVDRQELPPGERAHLEDRGTHKRVADRVAGQVAANRAVAGLVGGPFHVKRAPTGQPVVEGAADVAVTITHVDGEALALAVHGAHAGIDMEPVEPRSRAFTATWFTAGEQIRFAGDDGALTQAWAVKEAVLKALGAGMAVSPLDVEVLALPPESCSVRLLGEARARHETMGGAPIRVRLGTFRGRVVATAVFAA
jgi:malonyl CoA-acyl carrier protein transacylase